MDVCVRGGGGGGGVFWVRVHVRAFFKPIPIIYFVFEKNDLFIAYIYLIEQNVYIFTFLHTLCCPKTKFTKNKCYNFGF